MSRFASVLVNVLFVALIFAQSEAIQAVTTQDQVLRGPILASQDPFEEQITFQDVGTGRVWGLETPIPRYRLSSWTPDGCKVLVFKFYAGYYFLSITDLSMQELSPIGYHAQWTLDGQTLVFMDYHSETDSTDVYFADRYGRNPKLIHTIDSWITRPQWLSASEMVYSDGYDWFLWNVTTGQSQPIIPNPYDSPQEAGGRRFYNYSADNISPNWKMRAGFDDMTVYRAALDTRIIELTEEEIAQIKADEPKVPGFDLYFLKEGTTRHVALNGQFVQSLIWSPSSRKIAVTTDWEGSDFGIYVYDIEQDTLQRVADAQGAIAGAYIPSWSPDEEWLAFTTPEGYFIQRVSDGRRTQLDERMNGYTLHWSPVMDYSDSSCN